MSSKNEKLVLILERSSQILESTQNEGEVILQGIFAQFGIVNNNDRLYEESEYLPHLDYLQKKIKENRLLGELDHPEKFDISLTKTSHIIENLEYDKATRQLKGRVRLLDTPAGRIAKDLVKAGVPISISSRAAGLVESNKHVKIKKIFTYDLVADPGFENAVLSKMNESLGINNEFISVYDIPDAGKYPELMEDAADKTVETTETTKTNKHSAMEFVTTDEMNAYSIFVKEEFEKLQEKFNTLNESSQKTELTEKLDEMNGSMNKMQKYLDYLANTSDKSIQYTEYVAERLDKVIDYTSYVAKTLDETVSYTEHVAEKADQGIQYTEYMGEKVENAIEYSEYIGEKLSQTITYSEYLAENLDKGIAYSEYLAEQTQAVADYAEFAITENKGAGEGTSVSENDKNKETAKSVSESINYEQLPDKVDQLIESIKKQKTDHVNEKHFGITMLLDEAKRTEFKKMDEATKQKVLVALNDSAIKTEEDANRVWESVLTPYVEKWIEEAPQEYKQLWESLDEKSKKTLIAQSRTYKLDSPYQIKNFWETRPASILNKASEAALNESKNAEPLTVNPLGYSKEYTDMIGGLLGKLNRK